MKFFRCILLLVAVQVVYSSCVAANTGYTGKGVVIEQADKQAPSSMFLTDSGALTLKKEEVATILASVVAFYNIYADALYKDNAVTGISPQRTKPQHCPVFILMGKLII